MSTPVAVRLYGLYHLAGRTASVFASGIDCGDFMVSATGTLDVPIGAANGLFTAQFASGSFVAGFTYTSQGQQLRPITQQDTGAQNGPALGKTRRGHMFSALLVNTQGISFGTDFVNMHAAKFTSPGGRAYATGQLYSGVYWDSLENDYSFDSGVAWQITRPYPATVAAMSLFLQTQDR
jgi:hypothetical protein